jgi:hypothetical protein
MEKKSGSKIRNKPLGSYFRELINNVWLKILKIFVNSVLRILNPVSFFDPGSAIRDVKIPDLVSGINIPVLSHYHMSN